MDVIKASNASDFLGLVPALLGFTPTRSIVAIPFEGNRTLGAARFDLNPAHDPSEIASTTVGIICRVEAADGLAVVVYTDDDGYARAYLYLPELIVRWRSREKRTDETYTSLDST